MKLYRAKLKSRKRIMAEIPRVQQGWWADVCAGQTLMLRDATEADVARCSINEGQSRDPADYFCEACERGSLVRRIAVETLTEIADRRAAPVVADDGLPPPDVHASGDMFGAPTAYSAAKVRSAIAADRAARAQQQAQSIDTPEFADMMLAWALSKAGDEAAERYGKLIAYIDGRTAGAAPDDVRDSTWRKLLEAVVREFPRHMGRRNNGNAPGHCHSRPGIWDDDNGALAGKPCAWCIAWNGAADALAAAPSPQQGKEGA